MKKKNLALLISAIVLVVLAITSLLIVYGVTGDLVKFFNSKWAIIFLVAIIVYAVIVVIVLAREWVKKL